MMNTAIQTGSKIQIPGFLVLTSSEMTTDKMTYLFLKNRKQHTDATQGYEYTWSCYFSRAAVVLGSKWAKAECGPPQGYVCFFVKVAIRDNVGKDPWWLAFLSSLCLY